MALVGCLELHLTFVIQTCPYTKQYYNIIVLTPAFRENMLQHITTFTWKTYSITCPNNGGFLDYNVIFFLVIWDISIF